jgi:hypothetical protein
VGVSKKKIQGKKKVREASETGEKPTAEKSLRR